MKIPFYISFIGIIVSFALFVILASMPNETLLIAGVILFFLSGWMLAAKFLLCGVSFFSSVLSEK